MPIKRYVKQAKKVLDSNWTGEFTVPSRYLYPHQWNWDSGFIAIGYARYNTDRAIKELTRLFKAQWKNGMLPQIVFDEKNLGTYYPEPDVWQTHLLSADAPENFLTSGITMPPIHGVAVLRIYEYSKEKEKVKEFLKWIFPKLLNLHRYFYNERHPDGNGLIYIRHPWESGMDNSPTWDEILERIDVSNVKIPPIKRKDIKVVDPEVRPQDIDYKRYIYLVELFKKNRYIERDIFRECPFLVYDPLFNSILSASNKALIKIADIIGFSVREPEEWYLLTKKGISENLFNPERKIFDAYDITKKKLINVDTAAGFMPLFGSAASYDQAQKIYEYLNSTSFCALHQGNCFTIPNYNTLKEDFSRKNYWRGPVWININWMLYQGLKSYGFREKAVQLAKNILELPIRFGFYEYFDSFDGRGYGSKDFSWTASLFIDISYEGNYLSKNPFKNIKRVLWKTIILNEYPEREEIKLPPGDIAQKLLTSIRDIESKRFVTHGAVNYKLLKHSKEYEEYKKAAASLRYFDLDILSSEGEKLAFWINLYNAMVIDGIISMEVENSVKEVLRFFSKLKYRIGKYRFSLDDILHGILRRNRKAPGKLFKQFILLDSRKRYMVKKLDPRIHFAVACGASSCAPVKFFTPENIDEQLDIAAKSFVNSSEVIVIPEENRILLSEIFKWHEKDFGGRKGVLDFIEKYLVDDDKIDFLELNKDKVNVYYLPYNWNINYGT